jgi:hypothetical protein
MTNPWTAYVKDYLQAEGLRKASIHTLDGHVLATSERFSITAEQASRVWLYLKLKAKAPLESLTIAGLEYRINRCYTNFIYGHRETGGCVLAPSGDLLVIALHDEKMHAIQAVRIVIRLVEHLNSGRPMTQVPDL